MRIVLDTNVLVSAALRPEGHVAPILRLAAEGKFTVIVSPFILSEFERTLGSAKIGFEPERIAQAVAAVREIVTVIQPKTQLKVVQAKDSDNRILECAVDAKADALVTGDMHHIRPLGTVQGIEILTPREFRDKYLPGA